MRQEEKGRQTDREDKIIRNGEGATHRQPTQGKGLSRTKTWTQTTSKSKRHEQVRRHKGERIHQKVLNIMMWNIDGLNGRGRELKALIATCKPAVVILNDTKAGQRRYYERPGRGRPSRRYQQYGRSGEWHREQAYQGN